MRNILILLLIGIAAVIFFTTTGKNHSVAATTELSTALPAKLDSLFPPIAKAPVWLLNMQAMSVPLLGIMSDVQEGDFENAAKNYEGFKAKYMEISKLIPEWTKHFPMAPADELGAALKAGDQNRLMGAFDGIGKVCEDCHLQFMPIVQQKYHWDDFDMITVTDPLSNLNLQFAQMMLFMETSFNGVFVDLGQGQLDNARMQMQGFAARFEAIAQTCETCHETERKYFVDDNVKQMLTDMQTELNQQSPDMQTMGKLAEDIGTESCFKCHLVHIPAAYARANMKAGK